jgi:outer membrane protein insertion porin family/translocation and assembly module TamA
LAWCIAVLGLVGTRSATAQNANRRDLIVRGLHFTGNHAIDSYTLGISIATSNSSVWARFILTRKLFGEKRYLDEVEFRRDVLRIQAMYRLSGFLEARVDTVVRRGREDVSITFKITEGEPVRITDIAITGLDSIASPRQILSDLPLRVGDPFSRFLLRVSADTIKTWLQDRGYPFAEVYSGYDEDSITRKAQVNYTVDAGHLARVAAVAVTGVGKVSPRVVRRAVGIKAGQPYSRKALSQTQQTLYRTDLFTYVNVALVDSIRSGPDDSTVAIRVQVNEGKFHVIRGGAGYGALDCFRTSGGWTGRNFFGGGRSLDLSGRLSKIGGLSPVCFGLLSDVDTVRRKLNYEVAVSFREPFLFGNRTSGSVSFFAERHSEINTFTRISQGGQVGVSQQVTTNMPLSFTYDLSFGQTIADPAIYCINLNICQLEDTVFSARRRESTIGASLVWNGSNSLLDPSRGNSLSTQFRYSSPSIGSDPQRQFAKGVVEVTSYHPLTRRAVFAVRVRLGVVVPAQLGLLGANQQFVPPDERLYLGGPNTVRGYGQNELGPQVRVIVGYEPKPGAKPDSNGVVEVDSMKPIIRSSPTGGDRLVLANAELRVRVFGRFQAAFFVDVGEIYGGRPQSPNEALRATPGLGLRFTTPLGPIRLDVAWNPRDPDPGPLYQPVGSELKLFDPAFVPESGDFWHHLKWHFSIGQPF